jgi:hypothetical protein
MSGVRQLTRSPVRRRARFLLLAMLALCAQLSTALAPCELAAPEAPALAGAASLLAHCPCHIGDSPAPTPSAHWDAALPAEPEPQPAWAGHPSGGRAGDRAPWRAIAGPEPVPLV